jgi:Family of unknown function (DUF6085)
VTTWAEVIALVNEQAEDEGLWFMAMTAPEAYLQQELRRLHAAVEGLTEDRRHIIQFTPDGWTIAHPLAERLEGSLLDCRLRWNDEIPTQYWLDDDDMKARYWLNDNGTLGERIL